ncbi:MAG: hypothetical protein IT385_14980 [Deltaproteobacteria bacterium]|nr:hypothetical protein [Deltaproteobacteria bacterium]
MITRRLALACGLVLLPLVARADMWCAQLIAVHEWGVHVFGPDGAARPSDEVRADPARLPAWFVRPATHPSATRPPVRTLPADTGVRRLPVVTVWAPNAPAPGGIPLGLEVGFARGTASVWYPDVDRLLATTEPRELVWDRLELTTAPRLPPLPTDVPWVATSRGLEGALWVNGPRASERFVFYEADTHEPTPLALERAPGWTAARPVHRLTNRGRHPVHDVLVVRRTGDTRFVVHVPTLAPGEGHTFTLADHRVVDDAAWRRATHERLTGALTLAAPEPAAPPSATCVIGRQPAVPFVRADGHRLHRAEVDLLMAVWGERFFEGAGTRILYREDVGYLDEAMPLSVYTDMFHTVALRRAGLALQEGVAL